MKMSHWRETRAFSVAHDCEMARISGWDENLQEHWLMIPSGGKGYRDRREDAVVQVMEAIEKNHLPGEIE